MEVSEELKEKILNYLRTVTKAKKQGRREGHRGGEAFG